MVFMYLGYSGLVLRMADGTVAMDVSNLLKGEEIEALEDLDLLFTHNHWNHYEPETTVNIQSN